MTFSSKLERGREAFRQKKWGDAYSLLTSADQESSLAPSDLVLLARASYLVGKSADSTDIWMRAHQGYLNKDDPTQAAFSAFWLGMILLLHGDGAQGSGWIARAQRLVDDYQKDCAEKGFLMIPKALQCLRSGDYEKSYLLFGQAAETGNRFKNKDLIILGRLGRGQSLILQNRITEGTKLLDEAMVSVISDDISPIVAGIVYCAVIETCQKIYDLHRAQEWTGALTRWCESQPDLVPYRGQCLIRRVEIMQLHGEWREAINEVQRACELLSGPPGEPAAGEAYYRQAELCRLKGQFSKAEEMYRRASKWGRKAQPGMSLLRLAQGQTESAAAAIRSVEEETTDLITRSRILPAFVVIMIAAKDNHSAKAASQELCEIADEIQAPFLEGISNREYGRVLLAEGDPRTALRQLQNAWSLLEKIDAVYEAAQTRLLIGLACRESGDLDTMDMELDAAREIFQQLGAAHDLAFTESLISDTTPGNTFGLTHRELQVLRLLTTGKTNKAIAADLFISERTVDRHVSNILAKLNVSSRSAATAFAFKHSLT